MKEEKKANAKRKATSAVTAQKKRKSARAEPADGEESWDDNKGGDDNVDGDGAFTESSVSKWPRREAVASAAEASSNLIPSSNLASDQRA